jgi:hypothetical protein
MDIQNLSKELEERIEGRRLTVLLKSILRIQPLEWNELNRNNARLLAFLPFELTVPEWSLTMMEGKVRLSRAAPDDTPPLVTEASLPDFRTLRFASCQ